MALKPKDIIDAVTGAGNSVFSGIAKRLRGGEEDATVPPPAREDAAPATAAPPAPSTTDLRKFRTYSRPGACPGPGSPSAAMGPTAARSPENRTSRSASAWCSRHRRVAGMASSRSSGMAFPQTSQVP